MVVNYFCQLSTDARYTGNFIFARILNGKSGNSVEELYCAEVFAT